MAEFLRTDIHLLYFTLHTCVPYLSTLEMSSS